MQKKKKKVPKAKIVKGDGTTILPNGEIACGGWPKDRPFADLNGHPRQTATQAAEWVRKDGYTTYACNMAPLKTAHI